MVHHVTQLKCQQCIAVQGRPAGGITEEKAIYAKDVEHIQGLEEICEKIKPSVAIG